MNREVFITCAVTGSGDTTAKHPGVPITPKQIADASIEAAKAGAAIAHIHVRDPETGKAARAVQLYREVVDRIRSADVDVVINLTAGMGGDVVFGAGETPAAARPRRHRHGGAERAAGACRGAAAGNLHARLRHDELRARRLRDDQHALDAAGDGAPRCRRSACGRNCEVFDTGHLVFVKQLIAEKLIDDPCMIQLCMGIPYGAPDDPLDLAGAGQPIAAGRGVQRVLDRPQPVALCGDGGAGGRQRARRARGQSVPRPRRAGQQRRSWSSARRRSSPTWARACWRRRKRARN